ALDSLGHLRLPGTWLGGERDSQIIDGEVAQWRLGEAEDVRGRGVHVLGGDVSDLQPADPGSAVVDRSLGAVADVGFFAFATKELDRVYSKWAHCVAPNYVVDPDIFYRAAPAPQSLDPDPTVRALEHAGADRHVSHIAAHLATDHDGTVSPHHGAVGDHHVFAGHPILGLLGTGLDGNAVIANIDMTVADTYIAARFGIDTVGVR